jgi:Leucine-rich repeat (LRR) protein
VQLASQSGFSLTEWRPETLISLDLSRQQLQVFHIGALVGLQSLNLSHNFLSRITMGGLSACARLSNLDISRNLLADASNVAYLARLPCLSVLRMAGNPLAEDKHAK